MISESTLVGHWVHSHEEDTGDSMVFRPAAYPFPPSRGRYAYWLQPAGNLQAGQPGPTDKPETSGGNWSVENDVVVLHPAGGRPVRFQVVSVDPERLVVRKQ